MEEKHQELQDQDLLGSPHLEERGNGGFVDLDLLSQIPQRYERIMGGIKRGTRFSKVNNNGRERGKRVGRSLALWGRKGPFIGPHEIEPLQKKQGLDNPTYIEPDNPTTFCELQNSRFCEQQKSGSDNPTRFVSDNPTDRKLIETAKRKPQ